MDYKAQKNMISENEKLSRLAKIEKENQTEPNKRGR
jgi:hypothetical protein